MSNLIPLIAIPEYEGIYKSTPLSFCVPKGWNDVYAVLLEFFKEKDMRVETRNAIIKVVCEDPYCEFRIYVQKYMVLYDNEYDIILTFDRLKGDAEHMMFIMNILRDLLVESNYLTVNPEYGFENLM